MHICNTCSLHGVEVTILGTITVTDLSSMHVRGGSNEYPQSMFLNRNKKNYVYPCKPQFYYIKVGFKGVNII